MSKEGTFRGKVQRSHNSKPNNMITVAVEVCYYWFNNDQSYYYRKVFLPISATVKRRKSVGVSSVWLTNWSISGACSQSRYGSRLPVGVMERVICRRRYCLWPSDATYQQMLPLFIRRLHGWRVDISLVRFPRILLWQLLLCCKNQYVIQTP